jgi:CheY-like chemotaxis protein
MPARNGTLLLIDDELAPMAYYLKALRLHGFDVIEVDSADAAWEFFEGEHPPIRSIVLDIMMPPGKYFSKVDHNQGLRTGIFIYQRILEHQAVGQGQQCACPMAVLTNVTDSETLFMLEAIRIGHLDLPAAKQFRIWQKSEVSVMAFAGQILRWLGELEGDGP